MFVNSTTDIKKEVKENCDVKHGIKAECKVVLKKLKIEVKPEDYKEVVRLPDDNEQPVNNEFFTAEVNFNRNEMNIQTEKCRVCWKRVTTGVSSVKFVLLEQPLCRPTTVAMATRLGVGPVQPVGHSTKEP
ncbi:uncharacterized protein LOC111638292 isoform X2 [Centruroides sculpturatus]|uniref:uncharacterized protein LOC111638292 isoform X2 n=1 Tax=Centruroides sculpturatus TaxID=218467 RepID=UPI000C6D354F|nr:uncharacterized protein LOC111638292 isoform X2 [Centruroides sculpturatus]